MDSQDLRNLSEAYNNVYMENMSEELNQSIVEAEVLAQKGGVPGSVKVRPALSIPGTSIGVGPNKPVPGTFTTTTPGQREKIKQGDTHIDTGVGGMKPRVGAGPTSSERQRYNRKAIETGARPMEQHVPDTFDIILEYLVAEGYADTNDNALVIMANMSEEWRQSITEALRDIWSKPGVAAQAQMKSPFANQSTKPLPSTTSPFSKPASKTDSGKLTTYGAGGGAAAERSGKSRSDVMRQGASNLENRRRVQAKNDGPDFGR